MAPESAAGEGEAATLDYLCLGRIRVMRQGESLPIGGLKQRAVLGLLLANRNRHVAMTSMADAVWNGEPPDNYAANIQVYVSELRRSLRTGSGSPIETVPSGYRLVAAAEACDGGRFELARAEARAAVASGRYSEAADHYRRALGEWTGPAYDDLIELQTFAHLSTAFEEERIAALESRVDADLRAGRREELVAELYAITTQYPLHERFWEQLMLALYRCGRQADALDSFRKIRDLLADELGLDPGPDLLQMEQWILNHDPRAARPQATPLSTTAATTHRVTELNVLRAELVAVDGASVPVAGSGLRIGRQSDNDLVLDDRDVSRFHAVISATLAGFVLTDLHSTNGTRLNGEVVGDRLLQPNDEIRFGHTTFTFQLPGARS